MIESIYNKSLDLLRELGVPFKMDDIASEMGISKKTIYKYYPSKEVLIKKMINECDVTFQSNNRSIIYNNNLTEINKLFLLLETLPKESILYTRHVIEELKHYYPTQAIALEKHMSNRKEAIQKQFEYALRSPYMNSVSFDVFYAMYHSIFDLWQDDISKTIDTFKTNAIKILREGLIKE